MCPDVHLRPDRLREHAAAAAALSEVLRAVLGAPPPVLPPRLDAERERLDTAVRRAVRELGELDAALGAVAAAAEAADAGAASAVRRTMDLP